MARTGTLTLNQGTGKNSGKPYTALKLTVGKWSTLHFPTAFERDYLVEYFKTQEGRIENSPSENTITLIAGDYSHQYVIESPFEAKYVKQFLTTDDIQAPADSKINLEEEDTSSGSIFDN